MTKEYVAAVFELIDIIKAAGTEDDPNFDTKMAEARQFVDSEAPKFGKEGYEMWNDAGDIMYRQYLNN